MKRVHSTNTNPERVVRSLLHRMGFRFRLYRSDLPGKPDVVLPRYRTAIFVHGCFWYRHKECSRATIPATNQAYWLQKFERTERRDLKNQERLRSLGWNVLIVWECELKSVSTLKKRLLSQVSKGAPVSYAKNSSFLTAAEHQTEYDANP